MCFQDIKIGRNTQVIHSTATLAATRTTVVKRDPRRIAVLFPPLEAGAYIVHPEDVSSVSLGYPVSLATGPLLLTIDRFGDLVRGEFGVSHSATAGTVLATEIVLLDDSEGKAK